MDKMEMAQTALTGMTLPELLVVVFCSIGIVVLLLGLVLWINKQQMEKFSALFEPLKDIPVILAGLQAKVKSGVELEVMIDKKIEYHALKCPLTDKIKRYMEKNK